MRDWKKDLDKLEQQLKEEENGQQTTRQLSKGGRNSGRSDNDDSVGKIQYGADSSDGGRGGNVLYRPLSEQVVKNKVTRKEEIMITAEAAARDLEEIEEAAVTDGVKVVRAIKVLVKFLSTMRSNQLLTDNDKLSIQKAKATRKPEEKKA